MSVFNFFYFHFNYEGLPCHKKMMCFYEIIIEQRIVWEEK